MTNLDYRSLALAALFEALAEVQNTAEGRSGDDIEHLLVPLFAIDADSLAAVFAPPPRYGKGVKMAGSAIAGERSALRLLNYAFAVMELATLLKREDRIAEQLSQRLRALADAPRDAALLLALDEAYQETIGRLGKRIQVSGDPAALKQPQVAARIRALLLAAVRFAWLWRQLGGRRWQLIVGRRKALAAMDELQRKLA